MLKNIFIKFTPFSTLKQLHHFKISFPLSPSKFYFVLFRLQSCLSKLKDITSKHIIAVSLSLNINH
jgi:hypothetical protein